MALRFGVCGTGYWAQEAHATALAAHPETELVGFWGRDPARTEAAAARFGVAGHTDLDRLLAEVDAVAVAVPRTSRPSWPPGPPPPAATCCSTSRWPCRPPPPGEWPRRWPPARWPR